MFGRILVVALALAVTSTTALGQSKPLAGAWPQFRGPNRDDVSTETGLLKEWPKDGPTLLWQTQGAGRGYASPVVADGKVFTLGDGPSTSDDKDEYVLCFNEADGKPLWKTKTGPAWNMKTEDWGSSRSTPTVDGELIYALTANGDLFCLETSNGKEKWHKNLKKDFGGNKGDQWGYSESVLIDGDHLICTPGGDKASMVALDKKTGEKKWQAAFPKIKGAGHASVVISEIGGTKVYVQSYPQGGGEPAVVGVRAKDGVVLWTHPLNKEGGGKGPAAVIPTPVVHGDLIFVTVGYGVGGELIRQVADGDKVKVEEVYGITKDLENKHGGVVLVGDYLYGGKGDSNLAFCADLKTGKVKWSTRGSGTGSTSITAADGNLYVHYANGVMALVPANPEAYKETSSFKIPQSGKRPGWSHPVVADGKLFIREQDYLFCYDIKQK
jgi:outer membrane protein assembly factor BamB